jgi:hypothetical protein
LSAEFENSKWTMLTYPLESGRVRAVLQRHENGEVVEKTFGWRDEIERLCLVDGLTAQVLPTTEAEYLKGLEKEWEAISPPPRRELPKKPKPAIRPVSKPHGRKFRV